MESKNKDFLNDYYGLIAEKIQKLDYESASDAIELIKSLKKTNNKIMIAGNGGSAAMASHVCVDFTKVAKIRATNFNEADLITCFANDYGYERLFEKAIQFYGDEGDIVILISSSGSSANVVNAAKYAKQLKMKVITLSGFENDNPLKKEGDINFWVDSNAYNIVEMTHHIWLLSFVDSIVGKISYPAS